MYGRGEMGRGEFMCSPKNEFNKAFQYQQAWEGAQGFRESGHTNQEGWTGGLNPAGKKGRETTKQQGMVKKIESGITHQVGGGSENLLAPKK